MYAKRFREMGTATDQAVEQRRDHRTQARRIRAEECQRYRKSSQRAIVNAVINSTEQALDRCRVALFEQD